MAAGLSSEDYSVTKNMHLSDISENRDDALWLLDKFALPHQLDENDTEKRLRLATSHFQCTSQACFESA